MKATPHRRLLLSLLLLLSILLAVAAIRRSSEVGAEAVRAPSLPPAPQAAITPASPTVVQAAATPAPSLDLSAYRTPYVPAPPSAGAVTPLAPGTSGFIWPVVGPITQLFGVPELGVGLPHTGVDIAQPAGSSVRAAESGRIVFAGGDPCCDLGYWVEINHGNRYATRYGHLMRPPTVLIGSYVTQGQVIGFSGNTGFSTGPHLHFEVRHDGVPIDPLSVLPGGANAPLALGR